MGFEPIKVWNRDELDKVLGGRDDIFPFMQMHLLDTVLWYDDFLGDTIRGDATAPGSYEIVTGVDGALNILADQANGVAELRASDGNGADTEYGGLSLPELAFKGDLNATIAVRLAIDAITTVKVEVGFTDVTTDAGAVNSLAGNTFTATDACLWILDTADTAFWQCAGIKAVAGAATKIEDSLAPVAATFETLVVSLRGDNAKFIRLNANGHKTYESAWMTNAIEGGNQICPWVFVQLRAGTIDRNVQLDYIAAWQNRTAS